MLGLLGKDTFYGTVGYVVSKKVGEEQLYIGDTIMVKSKRGICKGVIGHEKGKDIILTHTAEFIGLDDVEVIRILKRHTQLVENDTVNYMWNIKVNTLDNIKSRSEQVC